MTFAGILATCVVLIGPMLQEPPVQRPSRNWMKSSVRPLLLTVQEQWRKQDFEACLKTCQKAFSVENDFRSYFIEYAFESAIQTEQYGWLAEATTADDLERLKYGPLQAQQALIWLKTSQQEKAWAMDRRQLDNWIAIELRNHARLAPYAKLNRDVDLEFYLLLVISTNSTTPKPFWRTYATRAVNLKKKNPLGYIYRTGTYDLDNPEEKRMSFDDLVQAWKWGDEGIRQHVQQISLWRGAVYADVVKEAERQLALEKQTNPL